MTGTKAFGQRARITMSMPHPPLRRRAAISGRERPLTSPEARPERPRSSRIRCVIAGINALGRVIG